ncbi:hypothetical protein ARMA_1169 [Ardenticatena maritima]|uniref:NIPSNAP domain-containing protein n=2 Tax=Ardenticatena maritima TaxID=872965 RepID=A0A0M8K903_9CHLR|nr:hypothetical protein [Ardenticatena maritima]GAP62746.1 hypothetical protein ARMA_1169 [Ardenticatena maritima]
MARMKLLMSWDIRPGKETAYLDFITSEFAPRLIELGLEPTDGWYTVYGNGPQVLMGGITDDMETMREILSSDEWQELYEKLMEYVTNFSYKIVPATGRFQF